MTRTEMAPWHALRANRFEGLRFRRQHPIGPYVLDFYCDAVRLAVEIDGPFHDLGDAPERDAARDAWLAHRGIGTLRIPTRTVEANIDAALRLIAAEVTLRRR